MSSSSLYGLTESEFSTLSAKAIEAKAAAYCPYSKFRVGCSLIFEDGSVYTGCNIENASYPVGICAERTAISKAVSEGKRKIKALGVSTDITPPASPCGMCRQFIREFADLTLPIFMFDKDGNHIVKTLDELLPMSFGPEQLPQ